MRPKFLSWVKSAQHFLVLPRPSRAASCFPNSTINISNHVGAGESGKTTIFKQMKILEKDGDLDHSEMSTWVPSIFNNLQTQMRTVLVEGDRLSIVPSTTEEKVRRPETRAKLSLRAEDLRQ